MLSINSRLTFNINLKEKDTKINHSAKHSTIEQNAPWEQSELPNHDFGDIYPPRLN